MASRQDQSAESPDLWTLARAAAWLRLSQCELLGLLREGSLRYVRHGLRYRIHRAELERYRLLRRGP